jgi:hypothetical protein
MPLRQIANARIIERRHLRARENLRRGVKGLRRDTVFVIRRFLRAQNRFKAILSDLSR